MLDAPATMSGIALLLLIRDSNSQVPVNALIAEIDSGGSAGLFASLRCELPKFLIYRLRRAQREGREFGGNDKITPGHTSKQSLGGWDTTIK